MTLSIGRSLHPNTDSVRDFTHKPVTQDELKGSDPSLEALYRSLKAQKKLREASVTRNAARSEATKPFRHGTTGAVLATVGTAAVAALCTAVPPLLLGAAAIAVLAKGAVGGTKLVLELKKDRAQHDVDNLQGQMHSVYRALDPEPDQYGMAREI